MPAEVEIDYYEMHMQQVYAPILPNVNPTWVWGYNGVVPVRRFTPNRVGRCWCASSTISRRRIRCCCIARTRRCTCTATRRCPSTTATPATRRRRATQGLLVSDLPGRPHAVVPRPRRPSHRFQRLHGVGGAVSPARRPRAQLRSAGPRGRPGSYAQPYDCPLILRDAMFDNDGQLIFDDNFQSGVYGDVILVNGRPWPNMQRGTAQVPLPRPQRRPVALVRARAGGQGLDRQAAADGRRHRRRADAQRRRARRRCGSAWPSATRW